MSQSQKDQIKELYMECDDGTEINVKNRWFLNDEVGAPFELYGQEIKQKDRSEYDTPIITDFIREKHRKQYGLDGAYDTDEQIIDLQNIKPSGIVLKSKYDREIKKDVYVDVYDVLCCFEVTNPAIAHAVKKLLMPGNRGHKDMEQDLHEAIQSIYRGIEIEEERLGLTHVI